MKNIIFSMAVILTVVLNACAQDTIPIMRGVKLSTVKRTALDTGVLIPIQKNGKWEQTSVGDVILKTKEAIDPQLSLKASQTDLSNLDLQMRSDLAPKTALIDSLKNVVVAWHSAAFTPGTPINTSLFGFSSWKDGWHGVSFYNSQYGSVYDINTQSSAIELSPLQYNSNTNTYSSSTSTAYISDNDILMLQIKNGTVYAWYRMAANSRLAYEVTNMSNNLNSYISSDTLFKASGSFVKIGQTALSSRAGASNTIAIGRNAMMNTGLSVNNIAIGTNSLMNTTTGNINIAIGNSALQSNTTGNNNIAIGDNSQLATTTAIKNIGLGYESLKATTTGSANVSIGHQSMVSNVSGAQNVAIGTLALNKSTSSNNVAVGFNAMNKTTTGSGNVALGSNSMGNNTTGVGNIGIGSSSLQSLTTGSNNIAFGNNLSLMSSGSRNIAFGDFVLNEYSGSDAIGIGIGSLSQTTFRNIGIGSYSSEMNTSGVGNLSIGYHALRNNITGNRNIAIGDSAANLLSTGNFNIVIGNGVQAATATGDYQLNIGGWITGNNGAISIPKSLVVNSSNVVREADDISASFTIIGNGQTIDITDNKISDVSINSSGTIGTLTVNLPASTKDGKLITVHFNNRIGVTQGHKVQFNVGGVMQAVVVCDDASLDLVPAAVNSYEYDFNINGAAVQPTFTLRYSAQTGKYHLISRMF